jgi:serine protease AprX
MARTRSIALRPATAGRLAVAEMVRRLAVASRPMALAVAIAVGGAAFAPGAWHPAGPLWPKADPGLVAAARAASGSILPVIVREADPSSSSAEDLVRSIHGTVTRKLGIVGGFAASIPADRLPDLLSSDSISKVWGDGKIRMASANMRSYDRLPPNDDWRGTVGLPPGKDKGHGPNPTYGPTIALLDTGVSRVPDLGNRVLARVDLTPDKDGMDYFGHGTHMAGIIAGDGSQSSGRWVGANPKAYLVSIKVASRDGSTDVSEILAGLQWIMANRAAYNIRVLNLSFGTDSTQPYLIDPLDFAVEQVWRAGILVVVAAGNRGPDGGTINKPGDDPFVLTVGAADTQDTTDPADDTVAPFSSRGPTQDGFSKPDLVAPGVSIVSDRDVDSTIDKEHPNARVGDGYFKGSGTSQAAAIVSGIASLLFKTDPYLTPDGVKGILMQTAQPLPGSPAGSGTGEVDTQMAVRLAHRGAGSRITSNVGLLPSNGSGSLEVSRGSLHVYADLPGDGMYENDADATLDLVAGEIDVLGQPWTATGWMATGWAASAWPDLTALATGWNTMYWQGSSWGTTTVPGTSWSGTAWQATGWSATGWSATGWSATGWSATGWSADLWS